MSACQNQMIMYTKDLDMNSTACMGQRTENNEQSDISSVPPEGTSIFGRTMKFGCCPEG